MSVAHLVHPTGDREQDLRRWEYLAWLRYVRVARTLANTPLNRALDARKRVQAAKADFANAWQALSEELQ